MNLGDGKDSHRKREKEVNLGAHTESVCRKYQASFTPDLSVFTALHLAFIQLLKDSACAPV